MKLTAVSCQKQDAKHATSHNLGFFCLREGFISPNVPNWDIVFKLLKVGMV